MCSMRLVPGKVTGPGRKRRAEISRGSALATAAAVLIGVGPSVLGATAAGATNPSPGSWSIQERFAWCSGRYNGPSTHWHGARIAKGAATESASSCGATGWVGGTFGSERRLRLAIAPQCGPAEDLRDSVVITASWRQNRGNAHSVFFWISDSPSWTRPNIGGKPPVRWIRTTR